MIPVVYCKNLAKLVFRNSGGAVTRGLKHLLNGFKRFSKTNSTDPRQRVPLRLN